MFIVVFQRLLLEFFLDLVYFPVWWYTSGMIHAGQWCLKLLSNGNTRLGPGLWLKNIFVPMFGQWDWRGRLISFFMRLVNIIFRSIALLFWLLICTALFIAWLLIPIIFVYSILKSFS